MINLKLFLKEKQLVFETAKQELSWVKRNLRPKTLIKAGPNYLVNEKEMNELFQDYLRKQVRIHKEKVERVKELRNKKKYLKLRYENKI